MRSPTPIINHMIESFDLPTVEATFYSLMDIMSRWDIELQPEDLMPVLNQVNRSLHEPRDLITSIEHEYTAKDLRMVYCGKSGKSTFHQLTSREASRILMSIKSTRLVTNPDRGKGKTYRMNGFVTGERPRFTVSDAELM